MVQSVPEEVERAAHALALDAAAAEVVGTFEECGITSLLLKGPAVAHWIYSDDLDGRTYIDVDLLVEPIRFEDAERVLETLGYGHVDGDHRVAPRTWLHESEWQRLGPQPTYVDLHRGFHGVTDWTRWWSVMSAHTVVVTVGGRELHIPDAAGCALVVALHDSSTGRSNRSATDLQRALRTFSDDVWQEAARRAETIGVRPSLVLGLTLHEAGRMMITRLGLPTDLPPDVAIRSLVATGDDPGNVDRAWTLQIRLQSAGGWRQRIRVLLDIIFPSAEFFRQSRSLAGHGSLGLFAARVIRPLDLTARAPRILWLLAKGRRRARLRDRRPRT